MLREYQIPSYISFQSDISDHVREATNHVYSPDVTIDSDEIFSDPYDQSNSSDSSLRLHETHFGDSLSDIPRTVIHSPPGQDSFPPDSLPRLGNPIFDCELGCFISMEEYQIRQKERQSI